MLASVTPAPRLNRELFAIGLRLDDCIRGTDAEHADRLVARQMIRNALRNAGEPAAQLTLRTCLRCLSLQSLYRAELRDYERTTYELEDADPFSRSAAC
jgi:hypothetical protein